jgi:hypothetical protein
MDLTEEIIGVLAEADGSLVGAVLKALVQRVVVPVVVGVTRAAVGVRR